MLVSLKWLKDYIDFDLSAAQLADKLTMSGLEVDEIRTIRPAFSSVVVAKIISVRPHFSAENLSVCEVTDGDGNYSVVCGAKNIKAGNVVPLAKVGATIPGGYTIKSSVLRGEQSDGMLCSEAELEMGCDSSGIMQLPVSATLGKPLEQVVDWGDTVLDIGITPNRADCLSMLGIAREVAAITGKKIKIPATNIRESAEDINTLATVKIIDSDLCPRYTARMIKGVKVGPSPIWMKTRLEAAGLRPINNVVDVTNFVMLEMGQPLHAFDFRFLEEGRIIVRRSRPDEEFTSLDGKSRKLTDDALLICDGVKPVAIGGIMGGINSEVKDDTQTVLLESAYFNPTSIRRTARRLAMQTDASFRFERGIDPEATVTALNRAAQLIAELSGGAVCKGHIDEYPLKIPRTTDVLLRLKRINSVIGASIKNKEVFKILKSLDMQIRLSGKGQFLVTPPSHRVDITREIDLIEEIARLYGYDRIPVTLPKIAVAEIAAIGRLDLEERLRLLLAGCGYTEVINYSFIAPFFVGHLNLEENDERCRLVYIRNPLTEDQSVMRTTMIYGLLETLRKNANNDCFNLKIFEIGRIFFCRGKNELPEEKNILAGLLSGEVSDDLWGCKQAVDFFDIKGCIDNIFHDLKISNCSFRSGDAQPFLHPGKSGNIYIGDEFIGYLGEIHPDVLEKADLSKKAYVFEINMDILSKHVVDGINYREVSRYPAVMRDVAFVVSADVEGDFVVSSVWKQQEDLLENVRIFDIYAGKGLPEGTKSMGLRFSYRAPDKTLTDVEVNSVHEKIVRNVLHLTGAKIRGEIT